MFSSGGNTYLLSVITQSVLCSCWVNQIIRILLTNTGKNQQPLISVVSAFPDLLSHLKAWRVHGDKAELLDGHAYQTFHCGCNMHKVTCMIYLYIFSVNTWRTGPRPTVYVYRSDPRASNFPGGNMTFSVYNQQKLTATNSAVISIILIYLLKGVSPDRWH